MDAPDLDLDTNRPLIDQQYAEWERTYVRDLEQRITELEAENAWLKHAAGAFGELAERFNAVLRGRSDDQNASVRPALDRRQG
jgi:hypothetical protein